MWSLTSLRTKRISSFRKFRLLPPKDFFDSIGQNRKNSMRAYDFRFAPESGHCATESARPFRANTGIRTVCVSDWLRPRRHQLGWYHNAGRRRCPSCCTFSGTLFINIYPHIPSLIFSTDAGFPIPENACAERRKADFGGYPVALATFCVDGMKFALRC